MDMRNVMTTARLGRRRAITSMLAMLYLVLFAMLAVGFYASTNTAGQVSANEQRRYRALGAAESGMDFMRYQLFQVAIPPATTADQVITQIYNDLATQLNGTPNLGTKTVGIDLLATTINVPSQAGQYITLASDGSKFRCTITKATLSVGGTAIQADILANHVHHDDPSNLPEMPLPDTSMYAKYATTMYVAGKPTYDNVYIPANLNPIIGGPITFRGVLLIKSPNNVKFNGNVNFVGVVVSDNSGVGTLLTNVLTFTGSGNTSAGL